MSSGPVTTVDAKRLAAQGDALEARFPVAGFERVQELLAGPDGEIRARLTLQDLDGVPAGELLVEGRVTLACQRCLQPMAQPLASVSKLAFVASDEAPVPEGYEAVALDEGRLDLPRLVEDELLLSLPVLARHAEDCAAVPVAEQPQDARTQAAPMRRPFAGLKDLMKH